jgi:hypothetical protein
MKRRKFVLGVSALLLTFVLVLAGCGGGNPKSLAKQSYDLAQQALGAMFDPSKAAELEKKAVEIEAKVAKLSENDRAIYDAELARLASEALCGLGSLFKAATDAAGSTQELLEAASDAADALDAEAVKDAANEAADLLKDFGF